MACVSALSRTCSLLIEKNSAEAIAETYAKYLFTKKSSRNECNRAFYNAIIHIRPSRLKYIIAFRAESGFNVQKESKLLRSAGEI